MEESINKFHKKKDDNFILNNYKLLNYKDDYNCFIYFLNDYKFKLIIRKFNNSNIGWNEELILKLYDSLDNYYEEFKLGTSKKNNKIINLKTKIKLLQKEKVELKIPKKIYQTYKNNIYHNISHYNSVKSLLDYNPDYDYYFFNDIDCREFIKKNYENEILESYDRLYPCAYKADLFRYLLIYKYGGIYIDNKYLVRKSFDDIIKQNDINLYCQDINEKLLFNSLLISIPNDKNYKILIYHIINNIKNNLYGECPLHPTGPRLFYEYFKNENIKLKHNIKRPKENYINCSIVDSNHDIFLNTFYDGYYYNKNHRNQLKNDYDYCFRNKLIYLKQFVVINDYKFSILFDRNINFNIELIEENKKKIKIKCFGEILDFNKKISKNSKFIFINNNNHKIIELDLFKVFNNIVDIDL